MKGSYIVLNINPLDIIPQGNRIGVRAVAFEGTAASHMRLPFRYLRTPVYAITATVVRTPRQDHPNTQCSSSNVERGASHRGL